MEKLINNKQKREKILLSAAMYFAMYIVTLLVSLLIISFIMGNIDIFKWQYTDRAMVIYTSIGIYGVLCVILNDIQ